jgi:hypothetical protein
MTMTLRRINGSGESIFGGPPDPVLAASDPLKK